MATFGVKNEDVHDESYRKAGKLDTRDFLVGFDPIGTGLLASFRPSYWRRIGTAPPSARSVTN